MSLRCCAAGFALCTLLVLGLLLTSGDPPSQAEGVSLSPTPVAIHLSPAKPDSCADLSALETRLNMGEKLGEAENVRFQDCREAKQVLYDERAGRRQSAVGTGAEADFQRAPEEPSAAPVKKSVRSSAWRIEMDPEAFQGRKGLERLRQIQETKTPRRLATALDTLATSVKVAPVDEK